MVQNIEFDFSKLKGRIREVLNSQDRLAEQLGISKETMSRKMNNKISFSTTDIIHICMILDIPTDDIPKYFYTVIK